MRYATVFSKQALMVIFTVSLGLLHLNPGPIMAKEWQDILSAAIYDDFSSAEIDPTKWGIDNPDGVLSQSGGLLNADGPPQLSRGTIWSKFYFCGDFETVFDWRNFQVSADGFTHHHIGVSVQDLCNANENQADIIRGNSWVVLSGSIEGSILVNGKFADHCLVDPVSATSGLFKITRVGSTISLFYDIGGGWVPCGSAPNAFTGPVFLQINAETPRAGTFHASSDWITINSTASCTPDPDGDSDGDDLLDCWEINGYDHDDDGNIDVDLPALGANPL